MRRYKTERQKGKKSIYIINDENMHISVLLKYYFFARLIIFFAWVKTFFMVFPTKTALKTFPTHILLSFSLFLSPLLKLTELLNTNSHTFFIVRRDRKM